MVLLQKEILPAGKYLVSTKEGRKTRKFSAKDLRQISATANRMVKTGLHIPAPFEHHPAAVPVKEEITGDAYNNAGQWTRFWISNKNGKPALWGEVEVAGDKDDANSPAFKALNTAKSTSVCVKPEFQDGLGRNWENALLHVALVSHPVVPNQADFEMSDSEVVNMSMSVSTTPMTSPEDISGLAKKLREVCGLFLPENTTLESLPHNLMIAVEQYALSPSSSDPIEPVPVYMSQDGPKGDTKNKDQSMPLSDDQVQAILSKEITNPATGKPFTAEEINPPAQKDPRASALLKAFATRMQQQTTKMIQDRINNLVSTGRIDEETAKNVLMPKVEFQMSLDENGDLREHPLEVTLSTMESLPAKTPNAPPQPNPFQGLYEQNNPLVGGSNEEIPEDLKNKSIEQLLSFL